MSAAEAQRNPFRPELPRFRREVDRNNVPSRYNTPTPRRAAMVEDAAQRLRERKQIVEAQSVAMQAIRVLRIGASGRGVAPLRDVDAAALLDQLRTEEDRIVGATSPSRSASRSRSPPMMGAASPCGQHGCRQPSPYGRVPSKVGDVFHACDNKPRTERHPGTKVVPLRISKEDVNAKPLPLHFDPRYDHSPLPATSELTHFFSNYVPGVKGKHALPERYAVPSAENNRRLLIAAAKRAELERNEKIKLEHPPRRKWDFWRQREAQLRNRGQRASQDNPVSV